MQNRLQFSALWLLVALAFVSGATASVIPARHGTFRGEVRDELVSYRGIKYATAERFGPPVVFSYPPDTPHNASSFGIICFQQDLTLSSAPMSEDCLYLNIWVPARQIDRVLANSKPKLLPVLIYIHGGALCVGSGASELVNPSAYTSKDVILVTMNYRLGIFGFWRHPELTASQPSSPTNFGLLDQQLAIEWIKMNIEHFGGDPNEITLMGESAGAMSIFQHICALKQRKERYFKRAILQSSVIHEHPTDLESSYLAGHHWAAEVGCATSGDVLACMRRKSPLALVRSALFRWSPVGSPKLRQNLVFPVDDDVNFCSPKEALEQAEFDNSLSLIIGGSRDESTLFSYMAFPLLGPSVDMYHHFVDIGFLPEHREEILELYRLKDFASPFNTLCEILNDIRFFCPLRRGTKWMVSHGASVRRYLFNHTPRNNGERMGIYHTAEMPFFFKSAPGTFLWPDKLDTDELELAEKMTQLVTDFVYGRLTEAQWPIWTATEDPTMVFGNGNSTTITIQNGHRKQYCDYWEKAYPTGPILSDMELSAREELVFMIVNEGLWWYLHNRGIVHFLVITIFVLIVSCACKSRLGCTFLSPKST